MMDKLLPLLGRRVQAANALEAIEGVLVAADESNITIRISEESGYENGRHIVLKTKTISYIRIVDGEEEEKKR